MLLNITTDSFVFLQRFPCFIHILQLLGRAGSCQVRSQRAVKVKGSQSSPWEGAQGDYCKAAPEEKCHWMSETFQLFGVLHIFVWHGFAISYFLLPSRINLKCIQFWLCSQFHLTGFLREGKKKKKENFNLKTANAFSLVKHTSESFSEDWKSIVFSFC